MGIVCNIFTFSLQVSPSNELMQVFSVPLREPIEPNLCPTAVFDTEPGQFYVCGKKVADFYISDIYFYSVP